jgi:hypothetical protein
MFVNSSDAVSEDLYCVFEDIATSLEVEVAVVGRVKGARSIRRGFVVDF